MTAPSTRPPEFNLPLSGVAVTAGPDGIGETPFDDGPRAEALEIEGDDPRVALRSTLGMFATGVTIITTRVGEQVHGMTANAFMSVSLEPPLVLISVDRRTKMCGLLHEGSTYGVSVLCESQSTLSDRFAGRRGLREAPSRASTSSTTRRSSRARSPGSSRRSCAPTGAATTRCSSAASSTRTRARARRCCSTAAATSGSARATAPERPVTRAADATGPAVRRQLDWDGCFNVRDLGGLRTADGRAVRRGALVRADALERLTAAGWRALEAHGVRTVVDLRNADEIGADAAPRPAGLTTVRLALDRIEDREFWDRWSNGPVFGTPLYYRPHLDRFAHASAAVVAAIAHAAPGGVAYHCAGGRDRTA